MILNAVSNVTVCIYRREVTMILKAVSNVTVCIYRREVYHDSECCQ